MLPWDRSHDWVVQRYFNERAHLTIRFQRKDLSITELRAIRICLPQFRNMPPGEVRACIGSGGSLALGEMPTRQARSIAAAARAAGLDAVVEDASYISYIPYDRTTGCAWLIEDHTEARCVAEEMIVAGVPVEYIEA